MAINKIYEDPYALGEYVAAATARKARRENLDRSIDRSLDAQKANASLDLQRDRLAQDVAQADAARAANLQQNREGLAARFAADQADHAQAKDLLTARFAGESQLSGQQAIEKQIGDEIAAFNKLRPTLNTEGAALVSKRLALLGQLRKAQSTFPPGEHAKIFGQWLRENAEANLPSYVQQVPSAMDDLLANAVDANTLKPITPEDVQAGKIPAKMLYRRRDAEGRVAEYVPIAGPRPSSERTFQQEFDEDLARTPWGSVVLPIRDEHGRTKGVREFRPQTTGNKGEVTDAEFFSDHKNYGAMYGETEEEIRKELKAKEQMAAELESRPIRDVSVPPGLVHERMLARRASQRDLVQGLKNKEYFDPKTETGRKNLGEAVAGIQGAMTSIAGAFQELLGQFGDAPHQPPTRVIQNTDFAQPDQPTQVVQDTDFGPQPPAMVTQDSDFVPEQAAMPQDPAVQAKPTIKIRKADLEAEVQKQPAGTVLVTETGEQYEVQEETHKQTPPQGIVQPKSKAEFDSLPEGARYWHPTRSPKEGPLVKGSKQA